MLRLSDSANGIVVANKVLKVNYSIPIGSYLKLGYRPIGSSDPFTYVDPSPFYNKSPYDLLVNADFMYEIEMSTICGSCPEGKLSKPIYVLETLL